MKHVQQFVTDCAEKTYRDALSMSVYCHAHPLTSLRNILRKQNVVTSTDLLRMPSGSRVRVTGMVITIHTPPTKSGKKVMFLTLEDETGLLDVVVFSRAQNRFAKTILTSEVLTIEGRLQRHGHRGISTSVVMEKSLIGLCGPMTKLLGYVTQTLIERKKRVISPPVLTKVFRNYDDAGCDEQLMLGF